MSQFENQAEVDVVKPEDYEHLIEDYSHLAPPAPDEVLNGYVLKVTETEIIVDYGYKSEGMVPAEELRDATSGEIRVKRGDTIQVIIDHGRTQDGYAILSHRKAARLRVWDDLEAAFRDQLTISGAVTGRTKGGLAVDVGIEAFMPASQADARPPVNLDGFIGQSIPVRIIKLNRRRGNVVVSRKIVVEQEVSQRKAITLERLEEGAVVTGVVKTLTEYGAFIDLGGIDGLLHVTDISYSRVQHPSQALQIGEEISVKVLKFDRAKERVSLGIKQIAPDPWLTVDERYPSGARVFGRVVNVTDYGAFVELESGVEGLIHISEMTWSRRMKHPSKVVKPGDQVETVVLDLNAKERRISLGLKQLEPDPWTTAEQRYSVGSVVEGRVRNMADFGAFVEIEEGIDGLVHVSDFSWTKKIAHPSEVVKKGQIIQAVVLSMDAQSRRLSLGVKQLQPDAWEVYFQKHQTGDIVTGTILRSSTFGVFVELSEGVEGLCRFAEIPGPADKRSREAQIVIGQPYTFKIVKINEAEKKIALSMKGVADAEEKSRHEDYRRQAAAATSSMEDVLSAKQAAQDRRATQSSKA